LDVINCLFYGNICEELAMDGGCFNRYQHDGVAARLENCSGSFVNNTVTQNGGWSSVRITGTMTVKNNIIWGSLSDVFGSNDDYGIGSINATYSDIGTGNTAGTGNISGDPLFVNGYHLSQIAAGQGADSPCVDAGGNPSSDDGLDAFTTRTDAVYDAGTVDMGYHYPIPGVPVLYVQANGDVTYTPEGGSVYDLIRGDLANVADAGASIDLGDVTCMGNDDVTGAVNDPVVPDTGQTFFYLLRNDTTASGYGTSSDNKERTPTGGTDCS
jgi:hypothetical protein